MDNQNHQQDAEQGNEGFKKPAPPFTLDAASRQVVMLAKRVSENAALFAQATENFVVAVDALGDNPGNPLDGIECDTTDRDVVLAHLHMLIDVIKGWCFPHTVGEITVTREPSQRLELRVALLSDERFSQEGA